MIITLCGSTRFKKESERAMADLTMAGHVVISVGLFGHADNIKFTKEQKRMLDAMHYKKISMSDAIVVINPGGYIGESTENERAYARTFDKKIYYMYSDGVNYSSAYDRLIEYAIWRTEPERKKRRR